MAFIQASQFVTGNATNGNAAAAITVTAGNTLIVLAQHSYAGCPPTASDNLGNTFTKKNTLSTSSGVYVIWTAPVTVAGSCTVTLAAGCGSLRFSSVLEYSNLTADPYDKSATSDGTTNSMSSPSVTPGYDNELILGMFNGTAGGSAFAPAGGETTRITENVTSILSIVEDKTQSAAGPITVSATGSGVNFATFPALILIATFRQTPIFVQQAVNAAGAGQSSLAVTINGVTAGNMLAINGTWGTTQTPTVTDSNGTISTGLAQTTWHSGSSSAGVYYVKNANSGTHVITFTFSPNSDFPSVYVTEYSGLDKVAPFDTTKVGTGAGNTWSSGAQNTSVDNEVGIGFGDQAQSVVGTAVAPFTSRTPDSANSERMSDYISKLTSGSSMTSSFTTAGVGTADWVDVLALYKPAGPVTPGTVTTDFFLSLLGAGA